MDDSRARALKLWVVLSRAFAAVADRSREDIRRRGLSPSAFAVLEALHHKGPMPAGELRDAVLLAGGAATYVVDRLEREGLVVRSPGADRRVRTVALTPEGRATIARHFPAHAAAVQRAVAALDPSERETAIALLKKLGKGATAPGSRGSGPRASGSRSPAGGGRRGRPS